MVKEGALKNPTPQAVFGLHLNSRTPLGRAGYRAGPFMASGDTLKIVVAAGGEPAIGVAIAMDKGADVIRLGQRLRAEVRRVQADLPQGLDIHVVADQPEVVNRSIKLFMSSLSEALIIVLAVSFLSLGLRTGTVVALSIPLVLAITFLIMEVVGIDLQRVSLGALIIALGLLVDDAIIAVEMMVVKMEQGCDRFRAATFAYSSTAFPMLTGTLITGAAFTPLVGAVLPEQPDEWAKARRSLGHDILTRCRLTTVPTAEVAEPLALTA